jgi:hypothetical protein
LPRWRLQGVVTGVATADISAVAIAGANGLILGVSVLPLLVALDWATRSRRQFVSRYRPLARAPSASIAISPLSRRTAPTRPTGGRSDGCCGLAGILFQSQDDKEMNSVQNTEAAPTPDISSARTDTGALMRPKSISDLLPAKSQLLTRSPRRQASSVGGTSRPSACAVIEFSNGTSSSRCVRSEPPPFS